MTLRRRALLMTGLAAAVRCPQARAGGQAEEQLADAVRTALSAAVGDIAPPRPSFDTMDQRLAYLR